MSKVNKRVKNVTINVTKRCVERGEPMDADSCPIALALKGLRYTDVNVGGEDDTYASSRTGANQYNFVLPKKALQFIDTFDSDPEKAKPFKFTAKRVLIIPEGTDELEFND